MITLKLSPLLTQIVAVLALTSCAAMRTLPDHPGAIAAIEDYYRAHAWEDGARCLMPEMDVTRATVVSTESSRLVVETRYYWEDQRHESDTGGNICGGFATRTFTLENGRVVGMTGSQRS